MDEDVRFGDRLAIEDDKETLFGSPDEAATVDGDEPARIWRLYTAGDGYEGVSSAMTLKDARAFASALREEGVTVRRLQSARGEVLDDRHAVPSATADIVLARHASRTSI